MNLVFFFFFVRFGVQNSFILNFDGVTIFAVAVKLGFFFSFFFHVNVLEKKSWSVGEKGTFVEEKD